MQVHRWRRVNSAMHMIIRMSTRQSSVRWASTNGRFHSQWTIPLRCIRLSSIWRDQAHQKWHLVTAAFWTNGLSSSILEISVDIFEYLPIRRTPFLIDWISLSWDRDNKCPLDKLFRSKLLSRASSIIVIGPNGQPLNHFKGIGALSWEDQQATKRKLSKKMFSSSLSFPLGISELCAEGSPPSSGRCGVRASSLARRCSEKKVFDLPFKRVHQLRE